MRRLQGIFAMTKLLSLLAGAIGCVTRPLSPHETASSAAPEATANGGNGYTPAERLLLARLARAALERAVREGQALDVPNDLPDPLRTMRGNFVTLTIDGALRGCIGNIYPDMPLAKAVVTNAYRAALHDPRFSPVTPDILGRIDIEVSVLSEPRPLSFQSPSELLEKLRPHRDGVVLKRGMQRSTFLPQVWEKLPHAKEFLEHLSVKAGLGRDAWREPGIEIFIYHVEAFTESELGRKSGG